MDLSEVWRAANEMIAMFGDDAAIRAAMKADAELDVGEIEESRFWKRVVAAINDLRRTSACRAGTLWVRRLDIARRPQRGYPGWRDYRKLQRRTATMIFVNEIELSEHVCDRF
jgi:hypothetical protein